MDFVVGLLREISCLNLSRNYWGLVLREEERRSNLILILNIESDLVKGRN